MTFPYHYVTVSCIPYIHTLLAKQHATGISLLFLTNASVALRYHDSPGMDYLINLNMHMDNVKGVWRLSFTVNTIYRYLHIIFVLNSMANVFLTSLHIYLVMSTILIQRNETYSQYLRVDLSDTVFCDAS